MTLIIAPGEEPEPRDYTLAENVDYEVEQPLNLWAYVKTSNVNLRDAAATDGKIVGKANRGDFYPIRQIDGDWALIEIPYGVKARSITSTPDS